MFVDHGLRKGRPEVSIHLLDAALHRKRRSGRGHPDRADPKEFRVEKKELSTDSFFSSNKM